MMFEEAARQAASANNPPQEPQSPPPEDSLFDDILDRIDTSVAETDIDSALQDYTDAINSVRYLAREKKMDKNVGGGIDRDKIPASDFAGKNRSFPIVTPQDVADAARSIGRAGSGNYDSATLKKNIMRIAKRKGAAFTAKLPASWKESGGVRIMSDQEINEVNASTLLMTLVERGARHSKRDLSMLQQIHDHAGVLGADCPGMSESDRALLRVVSDSCHDCREAKSSTGEVEMSFDEIRSAIDNAIRAEVGKGYYCWVREVYDDHFIYSQTQRSADGDCITGGKSSLYDRAYTLNEDKETVALGKEKTEVRARMVYEPVNGPGTPSPSPNAGNDKADQESKPVTADAHAGETKLTESITALSERAVSKDGTVRLKVIVPGHGSSGYYPESTLKRDGPKVFTKGLHMYADHPTATESKERPERSIRDLMAVLEEDAKWDTKPDGPGLYAKAKVKEHYRPLVNDYAKDIGVSIRAWGKAKESEIDGRKCKEITDLTGAESIDFVTRAGAGGKVLDLMESIRASLAPENTSDPTSEEKEKEPIPDPDSAVEVAASGREEKQSMSEKTNPAATADGVSIDDLKTLRERISALETENARMKERDQMITVREYAYSVIERKGAKLPAITKGRLRKQYSELLDPPMTATGDLDKKALEEMIVASIIDEAKYLKETTGAGSVFAAGGGEVLEAIEPMNEGELEKRFSESLKKTFTH